LVSPDGSNLASALAFREAEDSLVTSPLTRSSQIDHYRLAEIGFQARFLQAVQPPHHIRNALAQFFPIGQLGFLLSNRGAPRKDKSDPI
jgi:hypothetical protein